MGQHVLAPPPLDKLSVRLHALCRECLPEQARDVPALLQAAELQRIVNRNATGVHGLKYVLCTPSANWHACPRIGVPRSMMRAGLVQ
jgi:hypothetical protein